nr:putative reverse transcriptase domain-containing protein [Tanacetum cinerariifolium]
MRDFTLNFLNHPFNIDLLSVELGSFNVIIGMDWLSRYNAVIACAKKLVRIPFRNEILTIHGEGSNERNESRLNIISQVEGEATGRRTDYSRISQVARAPYWLAPSEMKELVQFLGYMIDSQGIHVDPAKIESVKDWVSPKSPTEIRQFLGLAGYYRRLIKGFLKIAKPMTKLTQKKVNFEWGDKQHAAF